MLAKIEEITALSLIEDFVGSAEGEAALAMISKNQVDEKSNPQHEKIMADIREFRVGMTSE